MEYLLLIIARFFAVTVVLVFHEFAHAFAAHKCGDDTAKFQGRMSLNPVKHFDLIGLASFVLIGFGWAKPVPVNPNNFNNYRKGSFWTSAAGILMNYFMAFLAYPIYLLMAYFVYPLLYEVYAGAFLVNISYLLFAYSLSFAFFNFLPLYPLDGFRMVDAVNTKKGKIYWFLRQYGYYILLGLIVINMLAQYVQFFDYINVLGWLSWFAIRIAGKPITLLWDWIFSFII